MTQQKDLKRRVRARMTKTGESYTAARARVLGESLAPPRRPAEDVARYAERAGMRDESVREKTGRSWAEWVAALDAIGAAALSHRDIARAIGERWPEIGGWWAQSVTVGYERIRGLRERGQQRTDGTFEAGKTRTFAVPIAELEAAFTSASRRARWLDLEPELRATRAKHTVRMTWPDGSVVTALFTAKGEAKSSVAISHTKLRAKDDVARAKREWDARFEQLARLFSR